MNLRPATCALLFGAVGVGSMIAPSPVGAVAVPDASSFCARVSAGVTAGDVADPELIELSGLAASHAHPGVLWANNDSGDTARLFAVSDTGAALGVFAVPGADAIDWEDVAVGPGPVVGQSYLYIADIGDNQAARDHVTVYRVAEPAAAPDGTDGSLPGVETFAVTYPDGAEDAESLFVDPATADVYVVTKQSSGASRVLEVAAADLNPTGTATMTQVAAVQIADTGSFAPGTGLGLPSTMATSADISPDGRTILVRTYQQVLAFSRTVGQSVGDAMSGTPCEAAQVAEPQGEAIAFSADGNAYYTSGEVQLAQQLGVQAATDPLPLARFDIAPPVEAVATTLPAQPPTEPAASAPAATDATVTEPATTVPAVTEPSVSATDASATTTVSPASSVATTPESSDAGDGGGGDSSAGLRFAIAGAIVVLAAGASYWLARRRARRSGH